MDSLPGISDRRHGGWFGRRTDVLPPGRGRGNRRECGRFLSGGARAPTLHQVQDSSPRGVYFGGGFLGTQVAPAGSASHGWAESHQM